MRVHTDEAAVVYSARLHRIIFLSPVLFSLFVLMLCIFAPVLGILLLVLVCFSVLWFLILWMTYHSSFLLIKKKQVILRSGFLLRKTVDIPLAHIETIDIRQSILGSILNYGSFFITGTGGTVHLMYFLSNPLTCRRYIEQLMNEV